METVLAAVFGAAGLVGAAIVTAQASMKITSATKRADANTTRIDATADRLWTIIDSLRADKQDLAKENGKLRRELKMCQDQREK
jgi:hypothetical protein